MLLSELIGKKVAIIDGYRNSERLIGKLTKIEDGGDRYYFYTKDDVFPASKKAIDHLIKTCKKETYYKQGQRKQLVQAGTAYVLELSRHKDIDYINYLKNL